MRRRGPHRAAVPLLDGHELTGRAGAARRRRRGALGLAARRRRRARRRRARGLARGLVLQRLARGRRRREEALPRARRRKLRVAPALDDAAAVHYEDRVDLVVLQVLP